uniref:Uncharacterized protein n=1 Tax=Panagrolaimus sp. JU765 TaxID=591449 RepID=A0AC34QRY6_9BILA
MAWADWLNEHPLLAIFILLILQLPILYSISSTARFYIRMTLKKKNEPISKKQKLSLKMEKQQKIMDKIKQEVSEEDDEEKPISKKGKTSLNSNNVQKSKDDETEDESDSDEEDDDEPAPKKKKMIGVLWEKKIKAEF